MNHKQWEALCDGCAKCCEMKDTGVACMHLDTITRRCRVYANRQEVAPWCTKVTPDNVARLQQHKILPDSCGYVRHARGQPPLPPDEVPVARLIPYNMADRRIIERHQAAVAAMPKR